MESNSKFMSSHLRNYSIHGGTTKDHMSSNKVLIRDTWRNISSMGESSCVNNEDHHHVFSWPPRSYTCSFCKREFRSAQALGGHMNVHRRDRARLRQTPPRNTTTHHHQYSSLNLNLDPNPNPKPNLSSTSSSIMFRQPFTSSNLPQLMPSPPSAPLSTTAEIQKWCRSNYQTSMDHLSTTTSGDQVNASHVKTTKAFLKDKNFDVVKKAEVVRLNLEIGIVSHDSKDDLDLELRLGLGTLNYN